MRSRLAIFFWRHGQRVANIMSLTRRGVAKAEWRSSRAARRPVPPQRRREEVDNDDADAECVVCYEPIEPSKRMHFPCASHWVCEACWRRVDACPTCRVGKDGESGEARRERRERDERALQAVGMPRVTEVVAFVGGDPGPMAVENLTVVAPSGIPPGLRELLPDLLRRDLVQRRRGEFDTRAVRVRSLLEPFGEADHA